jgi:putative membrane-bound dehydrogenase-like protein
MTLHKLGFLALSVAVGCQQLLAAPRAAGRYDFPIYTNKPIGRQLTGAHAPAATLPLRPEDAQKKFTVPTGFEIRLFAAEPEVVNPVAMTWDERGRLWVLELYEYPLGAKAGEKPRDRIKILEDTDADGRADTVTVFADGLNLATGLLLGYGGVFVGQAPHLLFLEDTNRDDKADKQTVLLTGFGLEDRHELLNGFTWGPDGQLYMTHGVFTHSKVKDPNNPNAPEVYMNAAVARVHPRTKRFEVFADGTSNPWGVDFDRYGNAFVSACVIDHLFHLAPGGIYVRQSGTPTNPYAYQLLPSIVDHKHHMAAYSGVQVYEGDQYPEEYRGTILEGNIHDNAVHQDRLTPHGSSFKASFVRDFVRANDGWFMPVSTQVGPDGAVWVMDWYDRYPCYQNANADPDGVDREYGRIWRVVHVGASQGKPVPSRPDARMNLAKLTSEELVKLLGHPNIWQRRMAQRILSERRDSAVKPAIEKLLHEGKTLEARLTALWTLHSTGLLEERSLEIHATDKEPAIRAWAARLTGERGDASEAPLGRLASLAEDQEPSVRLAVAVAARQFVSGSLTVDTPPTARPANADTGEILARLIAQPGTADDPVLPFMIWMAAEPLVVSETDLALNWLLENGPTYMPLTGQLLGKTMRRLCDTRNPSLLDSAVDFLGAVPAEQAAFLLAGLDGLIEGQKGKALLPTKPTTEFIAKLSANPNRDVAARAQQLGTVWGDAASLKATLAKLSDATAPPADRIQAIRAARQSKTEAARQALVDTLDAGAADAVLVEIIRALAEVGGDAVGDLLVGKWKGLAPDTKRAAGEALVSRRGWARAFLAAIERKEISASELPTTTIRAFINSRDDYVRNNAQRAIGRYRDTDADKLKLIAEKRKVVLSGEPDLAAGHEVAKKTCLNCHKLHGEGAEVGPDLTGVGRSSLDGLLANVIDPNQIIGAGYENVEVETKDGRAVAGRLVESTDARVKLLAQGPKEEILAKADIASMRVSEVSVMPEGLEQMPDADFRNLIWFILNPPQDNRPLTPAVRRQLIGEDKPSANFAPLTDKESVALWNPEWRVICPDFEGAPAKLTDYAGRKNVLMTHPFDQQRGAVLERVIELPAGKRASLSFFVAAHEQGDWELRVRANERLLKQQLIDKAAERWKHITVDLTPFAGRKVVLHLENSANNWSWEFGYWAEVELKVGEQLQAGK